MTQFILFITIFLLVLVLYWNFNLKIRQYLLLLCSTGCSIYFCGIYFIYFFILINFVYIGCHFNSRKKHVDNRKRVFFINIFLLLSIFFSFKVVLATRTNNITFPLGLSYLLFRLTHYVVEKHRDAIPQHSWIEYIIYLLFFPTFLAGPIEKSQRLLLQIQKQKVFRIEYVNDGLKRILIGVVKKLFIANQISMFVFPILNAPHNHHSWQILISIYLLTFYLYMDFSAYSDIAIGTAKFFGIDIMENFSSPLLKSNLILFWRSWHISLHVWIRDYFFFPFFGRKSSTLKLYLGMFLSMFIFHIWHGFNINFAVLGLYHGIGIIICFWFINIKKKIGYSFLPNKPFVGKALGILLTNSYFSIGFVFFFIDNNKWWPIFGHLFQ